MPFWEEGQEEESWHYKIVNLTNFFRKALEEINNFIVSNWKIIIMHNNCNQETKVNQEKKKVL